MGYEINYDIWGKMSLSSDRKKVFKICFWIFTVVTLGAFLFYAAGNELSAAVSALDVMALELQEGSGIKEAFSEFCIDILEGAELG